MSIVTTSTPSTKFPGWIGHTDITTNASGAEIKREYWMTLDGGVYAIFIYGSKGNFTGELATKQRRASLGDTFAGWEVAHNEFGGWLADVVKEAERRQRVVNAKKAA